MQTLFPSLTLSFFPSDQQDDQPLYLFDPTFDRSAPELLQAYTIPRYFRDDLFSLLEKEDSTLTATTSSSTTTTISGASSSSHDTNINTSSNNNNCINTSNTNTSNSLNLNNTAATPARPDYRWLLIGGLRSGS